MLDNTVVVAAAQAVVATATTMVVVEDMEDSADLIVSWIFQTRGRQVSQQRCVP